MDLDDDGQKMSASSLSDPARFVCLVCSQERAYGLTAPLANLTRQATHQLSLITAAGAPLLDVVGMQLLPLRQVANEAGKNTALITSMQGINALNLEPS